jgi:hypothetical protein
MSATRVTAYNYMRRNNLECPLIGLRFGLFLERIDLLQLP